MEFLCHAGATGHTTSLKNAHAQSCHAEIRRTGEAIVAGTDYDCIEIGHGLPKVGIGFLTLLLMAARRIGVGITDLGTGGGIECGSSGSGRGRETLRYCFPGLH
jgi:hypothetical protein